MLATAEAATAQGPVTFNRDIAPILFASARPAIAPAAIGPFSTR